MGGYSSPTYVLSLLLLLHAPISALGDACTGVDCVKGKCVLDAVTGFNCICDSGWKKLTLGLITLPGCIIPNCTVDLQCGAPPTPAPPPPPPPSSPPPPFNLFDPCNLILCGDGTCIINATGSGPTAYYCQCNAGSANAANLTGLPCIKECAFGVDCSGFKIGNPTPLPPPPPSNGMLAPPPLLPGSPPNGSNKKSWSSRSCDGFNMVLLCAVILSLVM